MRPCTHLVMLGVLAAAALAGAGWPHAQDASEEYLIWTADRAASIGQALYATGRVGGFWDTRVGSTNRSYNYKLAATWLTPEAIRATARLAQIQGRLSDDQARKLVTEAEAVAGTVIMVEIDPREGSGVIPLDWEAFLQPKRGDGQPQVSVRGSNTPKLRDVKGLAGTRRRDYAYDRFWVAFPLAADEGQPLFSDSDVEAELVVRIYEKEGRVTWRIPESIRQRASGR